MNMRSLCFARVARERKAPWLWWDFADRLASDCRMAAGKFTAECAQKVRTPVFFKGERGLEEGEAT